jgi:hypothetical protein
VLRLDSVSELFVVSNPRQKQSVVISSLFYATLRIETNSQRPIYDAHVLDAVQYDQRTDIHRILVIEVVIAENDVPDHFTLVALEEVDNSVYRQNIHCMTSVEQVAKNEDFLYPSLFAVIHHLLHECELRVLKNSIRILSTEVQIAN